MKIIKAGNPKRFPMYKQTCWSCGCVFTAEQEEIKCEDRPCANLYFICPQAGCGKYVEAKLNDQKVVEGTLG